jgi:hypothetical protein
MTFGDKIREIEERAKDAAAEGKKKARNAWADTKANVEKARNELDARIDQM